MILQYTGDLVLWDRALQSSIGLWSQDDKIYVVDKYIKVIDQDDGEFQNRVHFYKAIL